MNQQTTILAQMEVLPSRTRTRWTFCLMSYRTKAATTTSQVSIQVSNQLPPKIYVKTILRFHHIEIKNSKKTQTKRIHWNWNHQWNCSLKALLDLCYPKCPITNTMMATRRETPRASRWVLLDLKCLSILTSITTSRWACIDLVTYCYQTMHPILRKRFISSWTR